MQKDTSIDWMSPDRLAHEFRTIQKQQQAILELLKKKGWDTEVCRKGSTVWDITGTTLPEVRWTQTRKDIL